MNPLLYVLALWGRLRGPGLTPTDPRGHGDRHRGAVRYPGFAFVNIQSPCVTYGEEAQQIKAQKEKMQSLEKLGHDPTSGLRAMDLAQDYGTKLYTGIFFIRSLNPGPTYEAAVKRSGKR